MSNVPKLRFKEFNDEWERKKIGDLGEFKKTYSFSRSVEGDGKYRHIHYGDIHMNYNGVISKEKFIPAIDIPDKEEYVFIEERDIIFADASEDKKDLGKVAIVKKIENNVLSGLHTICFKPSKELNSEFFLNHSLSDMYLKFMYIKGTGIKVLGISKANLVEYEFLAPSLPEQEKIASFLSLYDKKIELQEKKVESLKKYKKGMMQKIFSQELRFKDENGENYPEWDNKKIGELIEYGKAGGTPLSSVSEYYNGDIKFLSISDMTEQGKYIEYTEKTITQEGLDNSSAWIVPKGHLIYSMYASVGYPAINLIDLATSQAMFSMKIRNEYSTEFIYYSLLYFKDKGLRRIIETGTQGNLNANSVKQITINIPSLPEQEKIASLLSTIDKKIELEEKLLEKLKEYKKGLLQQMFV